MRIIWFEVHDLHNFLSHKILLKSITYERWRKQNAIQHNQNQCYEADHRITLRYLKFWIQSFDWKLFYKQKNKSLSSSMVILHFKCEIMLKYLHRKDNSKTIILSRFNPRNI